MRSRARLLILALLMMTLLTSVGCEPVEVEVNPADAPTETPAETTNPEDKPADIEWADPAVKYIIYASYLGHDKFSAFCAENSDAASEQWESPEGFWAYVELFDDYLEKNNIQVTERFLNSIRAIWVYRISDSWAVEIHHNDPAFKSKHPCVSIGFPLEISVNSLADFAHMENLESLQIFFTEIADLGPLSELKKLNQLWLHTAQITDLSPLVDFPALTDLEIDCEDAEDLSILSHIEGLEVLRLVTAHSPDFSFLQGLSRLEELQVYESEDIDMEALAEYSPPQLTCLALDTCGIEDISPLSRLTQLEVLELPRNEVVDLSPLSGLTKLKRLYIIMNQIRDISPLAGMKEMEELYLADNYISDISVVGELQELRELDVSFNNISDLSPIDSLKNLKSRFVTGNPRE